MFRKFSANINQSASQDDDSLLEEMKNVLASTANPLHSSCLCGDDYLQITKSFLDEGANIHALDNEQNTAIIVACKHGAYETIEFLLEKGANINDRDAYNRSVLHLICSGLDRDQSVKAVKTGRDLIVELVPKITDFTAQDDNGRTALHYLCDNIFSDSTTEKKIAQLAQKLIKLGCDANAEDILGNTALHLSCTTGGVQFARTLIPIVDDIDARNHDGNSALHLACQNGHTEIVGMILQHLKTNPTSNAAAEYEPYKNERGQTPLHLAGIANHSEIVEILIENNFDINAQDNAGNTPLNNRTEPPSVLEWVTNASSTMDAFAKEVAESNQIIPQDDLKLKIANCMAIEDENEKSNSLISAFREMCEHLEKDLNDFGNDFDIDAPQEYNLFIRKREVFVQKILQNLDTKIADDSQTTILHLLCQYGYSKAVELVIGRGENLEYQNNQGQTALHLAC